MREVLTGIMILALAFSLGGCSGATVTDVTGSEGNKELVGEEVLMDDMMEEVPEEEILEPELDFAEYEQSEVINFTLVDSEVAQGDEEAFDVKDIAGSYVNFYTDSLMGMTDDGVEYFFEGIIDSRIIINDDGTAVYSNQDTIPYEVKARCFVDENGTEIPYKYIDGNLVVGEDNLVFVKSNYDVTSDEDSLADARHEYVYATKEDREVAAGNYASKYYEEYEGEGMVGTAWLIIAEDGTAYTMFQDYGPSFTSVKNGEAVTEDGDTLLCAIAKDCIAIQFDGDETFTVFTRTDEECDFGAPEN